LKRNGRTKLKGKTDEQAEMNLMPLVLPTNKQTVVEEKKKAAEDARGMATHLIYIGDMTSGAVSQQVHFHMLIKQFHVWFTFTCSSFTFDSHSHVNVAVQIQFTCKWSRNRIN
jgi:hypothetical protein